MGSEDSNAASSIKPQYKAYIPAYIFPVSVCNVPTGPISSINIATFRKESTYGHPSNTRKPIIPITNEAIIMPREINAYLAKRLRNARWAKAFHERSNILINPLLDGLSAYAFTHFIKSKINRMWPSALIKPN
ncbi:MAG: hypothetical protein ABSD42_12125 [Candidatus Bathyarchaeia archaeon]